ncbi:flagellar hook assembly protein FlgD [Periweissella fabalis]|uniref:flagellar basal body rod modification protein n=1 Tax=Periweissella fabalis TaxID=1070421 RepID=UPI001B34896C|nr:flagellar basal body rod modification protein [Periweissella fabalis]MCM0599930.1 flagellar basal body rod modification protein [Periweissella fabalis]
MDIANNANALNTVLPGSVKISNNNDNGTGISMDQFLKIMAATMSNPSMDGGSGGGGAGNTDYLSQLAQFSELQKMNELGQNLQATVMMSQQQQAFGLMGQNVVVSDIDPSTKKPIAISGPVDRVQFNNGYAMIQVKGKYYDLSALNEVDGKLGPDTTNPIVPTPAPTDSSAPTN